MSNVTSLNAKKAAKMSFDAFNAEILRCCDLVQRGHVSIQEKDWIVTVFKEGYHRFDDPKVRQMLAFTINILEVYY